MTLLLVEDDMFFQRFYATKLRDQGCTVEVASNGEEALKIIRQSRFDVVLLDLIMPKLDGFEVLRILEMEDRLKELPVIVFSTLGQEHDVERARQLGAKDYMNKTFFNFEELMKKVKAVAG